MSRRAADELAVRLHREGDRAGRLPEPAQTKFEQLAGLLSELGSVLVAFSGGSDSALLAWSATRLLGGSRTLCVTAVSPSLAPEQLADCERLALEWGLRWEKVATAELDDPAYAANGTDRCYHCKSHLMAALLPMAKQRDATVVLGVNTDDLADYRPGQLAASERGARFPLADAGISKAEVREISRQLGLRTWDKPASPCLASRIPYATPVTLGSLRTVQLAESLLRSLGFRDLRVRHYGSLARVELPEADLVAAIERRSEVVEAVRSAGFEYVTLDLEGLRSGNLNAAIDAGAENGRATRDEAQPRRSGAVL